MSILSRLMARNQATYGGVDPQPAECCMGKELIPRWRGPDVMDDDSKAMGFVCHECGREYLPYQVHNRRLMRTP